MKHLTGKDLETYRRLHEAFMLTIREDDDPNVIAGFFLKMLMSILVESVGFEQALVQLSAAVNDSVLDLKQFLGE